MENDSQIAIGAIYRQTFYKEMDNNWKFYKDTKYLVSRDGLIKNSITGFLMTPRLDRYGYTKLNLRHEGKRLYKTVHRLVGETWLTNDQNLPQINHINGDKTDASIENLEWVTPKANIEHSYDTGLNSNRTPVKLTDIEKNQDTYFRSIKDLCRQLKVSMSVLVPLIKHSGNRPILDKYVVTVLDESKMFDISNTANFGKEIFIHDCLTEITTAYPSILIASYHTGLRYLNTLTGFEGCDSKAGYFISFDKDKIPKIIVENKDKILEERNAYILREYQPNKATYTLLNYYSRVETTFETLESVAEYLNSLEPLSRKINKMLISYVLFETGKSGRNGLIKGHGIKTSRHNAEWYEYTEEAILSNMYGYPATVRVFKVKTPEYDKIVFKLESVLEMFGISHWKNTKAKTESDVLKFLNIPNLNIERLNKPVKMSQ